MPEHKLQVVYMHKCQYSLQNHKLQPKNPLPLQGLFPGRHLLRIMVATKFFCIVLQSRCYPLARDEMVAD